MCPIKKLRFLKLVFASCSLSLQRVMSQSIPTGYNSPGNPRGFAQKACPGGRYLIFESWPGAENSTRTGIMWKMKLKLQNIAWIKFLQMKTKKKQVEFLTFFEVYVFFSIEFFLVFGSIFWFYCHTLQNNLRSCLWLVYLKFSLGYGFPRPPFA